MHHANMQEVGNQMPTSCISFPPNKSRMDTEQYRLLKNNISLHTFSSRKNLVKEHIYIFPVPSYIYQPDFYCQIISC